jgi:hypothetical protein
MENSLVRSSCSRIWLFCRPTLRLSTMTQASTATTASEVSPRGDQRVAGRPPGSSPDYHDVFNGTEQQLKALQFPIVPDLNHTDARDFQLTPGRSPIRAGVAIAVGRDAVYNVSPDPMTNA